MVGLLKLANRATKDGNLHTARALLRYALSAANREHKLHYSGRILVALRKLSEAERRLAIN